MGIFYHPPPPFQGGRQPLEKRKLTPPSAEVAATPDNPPFGHLDTIIDPWLQQPQPQQRLAGIAALIPAAVADVFVPLGRILVAAATTIAVTSYAAASPMPQMPGKLNPALLDNPPAAAAQVDNPPFGLLETNVDPWVGEFRLPQVNSKVVQGAAAAPAQVDNPPVKTTAAIQANIVNQWQPPFPQVLTVYVTLQEGAASQPPAQVDNPPSFRVGAQELVVRLWQPPDPLPTLPVKLVQPGQDDVYGESYADIVSISTFKGLPQQARKLNPALLDNPPAPAQVDDPPRKTFAQIQANIVAQWQPPFPQIVTVYVTLQEGPVVVAQVDNPPALHRNPDISAFFAPGPAPQQGGKLNPALLDNPPVVDNPPIIRMGQHELVVRLWQPPDPLPTLNVKLNGSLLDNPTVTPPVVRRAVGKVRRIPREEFDKLRRERFSEKYYNELFGLERAVDDADKAASDAKRERKDALEKAVEVASEAIDEASEREAYRAELRALTRALEAAASARKSSEAIAKANLAAEQARMLIEAFRQLEEEEEEAIAMLLLH